MAHISDRKAASVKALTEIHHVSPEIAEQVRTVWRTVTARGAARSQIDALIGTHGVEFLGIHKRTGESVYYCNAGDAYAATILFAGLRMRVGCWADLVEKNLIREVNASD